MNSIFDASPIKTIKINNKKDPLFVLFEQNKQLLNDSDYFEFNI